MSEKAAGPAGVLALGALVIAERGDGAAAWQLRMFSNEFPSRLFDQRLPPGVLVRLLASGLLPRGEPRKPAVAGLLAPIRFPCRGLVRLSRMAVAV